MPATDDEFDVLCYGTISLDNITRLRHLPSPRRDAEATAEYNSVGGEALSVAIPLAAWGCRVLLAGNVLGVDWKARFILEHLSRYPGIDTRYLRQHENVTTPFTRVLVTPDGERSRITYWYEETLKIELTKEMMQRAAILSADAYGGHESDRAAGVARQLGRPVVTADAFWPQYPLAGLSDVVIISQARLQTAFPGVYEYDHALELQEQGAGVVIVTDGGNPVLVVRADGSTFGVEPYEIRNPVDTSAAGHFFKAGIIYGWQQRDWSLEKKVQFACAAAALSCEREAVTMEPPGLAEIQALMRSRPRTASQGV